MDGTKRSVRISAMAWPAIVPNLKRYEILEIHIQPELSNVEHVDGPPEYQMAVGGVEESKEVHLQNRRRVRFPDGVLGMLSQNSLVGKFIQSFREKS